MRFSAFMCVWTLVHQVQVEALGTAVVGIKCLDAMCVTCTYFRNSVSGPPFSPNTCKCNNGYGQVDNECISTFHLEERIHFEFNWLTNSLSVINYVSGNPDATRSSVISAQPMSQNQGAYFDGASSISVAASVTYNVNTSPALSWFAWVRYVSTSANSYQTIVGFDSSSIAVFVNTANGQLVMSTSPGNAEVCATGLSGDTWHHVAVSLYQDLQTNFIESIIQIDRVGTNCQLSTFASFPISSTSSVYIGSQVSNGYFEGFISDFHLFEGIVQATQYSIYDSTSCSIGSCSLCAPNSICFPNTASNQYYDLTTSTSVTCAAAAGCLSCVSPGLDSYSCFNVNQQTLIHYTFSIVSQYVTNTVSSIKDLGVLGSSAVLYELSDPLLCGSSRGAWFDGVNDIITIASLENFLDSFTITFWFKPSGAQTEFPLFTKATAGGSEVLYLLFLQNGASQTFELHVQGTVSTSAVLTTSIIGKWAHITARHIGAIVEFLVNGLQHSSSVSVSYADPGSTLGYLGRNAPGTVFYQGFMAEVYVFNTFLVDGYIWEWYVYPSVFSCSGAAPCVRSTSCYLLQGSSLDTHPSTQAINGSTCFPCDYGMGCNNNRGNCWTCGKNCLTCDTNSSGTVLCLACRAHSSALSGGNCNCLANFAMVSGRCAGEGRGAYFQQDSSQGIYQYVTVDYQGNYNTPYMESSFTIIAWVYTTSATSLTPQVIFSKTLADFSKDLILLLIQNNKVQLVLQGLTTFSQTLTSQDQGTNCNFQTVNSWVMVAATYEELSTYREMRIYVGTKASSMTLTDMIVLDTDVFVDAIAPNALMFLGNRKTATGFIDGFNGYITNFQIWLGAFDIPQFNSNVITSSCTGTCSTCPDTPATCLYSCAPKTDTSSCTACPTTCTRYSSCDPTPMCWQCNSSCKTCSGTGSNQCLSCRPYMVLSGTRCNCMAGYSSLSASSGRCFKILAQFMFNNPSEYLYSNSGTGTGLLGNIDDYRETTNPLYAGQSRGLYFSGAQFSTITNIGTGALIDAFSIAFFFRDLSSDTNKHAIYYKASGSEVLYIYVSSMKVSVDIQWSSQTLTTFTASSAHNNKWNHFAFTYEVLDVWLHIEIYLNGVSVGYQDFYNLASWYSDLGTVAYMGAAVNTDYYMGYITAYFIYQGALQISDITQTHIDTTCVCATGYCERVSGTCLSLCLLTQFSNSGTCTACHVNCGANVSCETSISCFDCPESCITCKYEDPATGTDCITCAIMSTMAVSGPPGLCTCSAPLTAYPSSGKCYTFWTELSLGIIPGSYSQDLSGNNRYGIMGGSIDIYQRFIPPIAPVIMSDDRGVFFNGGQYAQFNQEGFTTFQDTFVTAVSLELWVRPTIVPGPNPGTIFSVNGNFPYANDWKLLVYITTTGYLAVSTNTLSLQMASAPLGTTWNHIVLAYEDLPISASTTSPQLILYLNGIRVLYGDVSVSLTQFVIDLTSLYLLGARLTSNFFGMEWYFTGFISSVRIHTGAIGRFDALFNYLSSTCTAANSACSVCPSSGTCFNTCSYTQYYSANTCTACYTCVPAYPCSGVACCSACPDGCSGPGSSNCLVCDSNCLTCAGTTSSDCTSCNVHYSTLVSSGIAQCSCNTGYIEAFDSAQLLHCIKLVLEYRIIEPNYPAVVETKAQLNTVWRGSTSATETSDPLPVSADRGLYFTGGTYISLPQQQILLQSFSITFWIRVNSLGSNGPIFSKNSSLRSDNIGIMCSYTAPNIVCKYGCRTTNIVTNPPCAVAAALASAQWFHVAVTYEESLSQTQATINLYLNGVLKGSTTCANFYEEESAVFTFGAFVSGGSVSGFKGMISLIQIWEGTLFSSFITSNLLKTVGCTGPCYGTCSSCPICTGCPAPFCYTCLASCPSTGCTGCSGCISGFNYKDNCDYGYYEDATGACQPCVGCSSCSVNGCFKCYRPLCIQCVNEYPTGCTKCAPNSSWNNAVADCVVNLGYFLVSLSPPVISPCILPCYTCIRSASLCTSCTGTLLLQSTGVCTCPEGQYNNGSTCIKCTTGCVSCSGPGLTDCLVCDASLHLTMSAGTCQCSVGYFLRFDGECSSCTLRCESCTTGTYITCTSCSAGFVLFNNQCANRNCTSAEFVDPATGLCTPCAAECMTCMMSADICTSCDTTHYYSGPATCYSCSTTIGYYYPKGQIMSQNSTAFEVCKEVCGDGIHLGQYVCDDGNLENGDGCSSVCTVEEGWTCSGGSLTSPDQCVWNNPPVGFLTLESSPSNSFLSDHIVMDVKFSEALVFLMSHPQLEKSDVYLTVTNADQYTWAFHTSDGQSYTVFLYPEQDLSPSNQAALHFVNRSEITNSNGQRLYNDSLLCNLTSFTHLDAATERAIQAAGISSYVNLGFTAVACVIGLGFYFGLGRPTGVLWRYVEFSQYVHFLRLQRVDFPLQLEVLFSMFGWSNGSFFPNFLTYAVGNADVQGQVPRKQFLDHGVENTLFFSNAGHMMLIGMVVGLVFPMLNFINNAFPMKQMHIFKRMQAVYFNQAVIRTILSSSMVVLLAALLQTTQSGAATGLQAISTTSAYLILAASYSGMCWLSWKNLSITESQVNSLSYQDRYGLLFEDYIQTSLCSRCFFVMYHLRRVNFCLALVFLNKVPTVQTHIIALNSLIFTILEATHFPYKSKWTGNVLNLASDICLTGSHYAFLSFSMNSWSSELQTAIGWILVSLLSIMAGAHFLALSLNQVRNVIQLMRKLKEPVNLNVSETRMDNDELMSNLPQLLNPPQTARLAN